MARNLRISTRCINTLPGLFTTSRSTQFSFTLLQSFFYDVLLTAVYLSLITHHSSFITGLLPTCTAAIPLVSLRYLTPTNPALAMASLSSSGSENSRMDSGR